MGCRSKALAPVDAFPVDDIAGRNVYGIIRLQQDASAIDL